MNPQETLSYYLRCCPAVERGQGKTPDFRLPSTVASSARSVLDISGQKEESLGNAVPCNLEQSRRVRMDLKPRRLVSSPHILLTTTCVQTLVDKIEKDQMTVT